MKIGTHSGTFHCDEALGCFLLKLTDQYKTARIVRTRSPEALQPLDIVIDVGGVYDPGIPGLNAYLPELGQHRSSHAALLASTPGIQAV